MNTSAGAPRGRRRGPATETAAASAARRRGDAGRTAESRPGPARSRHAAPNCVQLNTREVCVSRIFHMIFSDVRGTTVCARLTF